MAKSQTARTASERRRTEHVRVHGAYSGIDRVDRVVDTMRAMLRRRQISPREYQAGERIQQASETIVAPTGNVMDFDRACGGSVPGQPPAMACLVAADVLDQAYKHLYPRDYAVVWRVCVQGLRIDQCGHLFAHGRSGREEAGRALRRALGELADLWWPKGPNRTRTYRPEKPKAGHAEMTEAARVYFAG